MYKFKIKGTEYTFKVEDLEPASCEDIACGGINDCDYCPMECFHCQSDEGYVDLEYFLRVGVIEEVE